MPEVADADLVDEQAGEQTGKRVIVEEMAHLDRVAMIFGFRSVCRFIAEGEQLGDQHAQSPEQDKGGHEAEASGPGPAQSFTKVTCATSIPPPRNPPSQYMR
jgi:hypothetical protein